MHNDNYNYIAPASLLIYLPKLIPLISNTEGSKHLGPVPTTCDRRSACVKSLETRCSHSNGDSNRTHAKVLKTFGTIENI